MEFNTDQRQAQAVSPQAGQFMRVLQMGIQELREYVEDMLQENPVLELPEPGEELRGQEHFTRKLEWLEASDQQNSYYYSQDAEDEREDPLSKAGCFWDDEDSLSHYILSQFMGTELEREVMAAVEFLVERLDPNGFLDEDLSTLAEIAGSDLAVMSRALTELQAADPAGVGARSLAESLRLQIERRAGDHRLAVAIAEGYLGELAHNQYSVISRKLNAPEQEVRAACDLIRTLNPRPGAGFAAQENLEYLTPDIIVSVFPDRFEITANDAVVPQLKLSSYYNKLLRETGDEEVRGYLEEKASQAERFLKSIDQRRSMLLQCAQWVVKWQASFFYLGPGHLRPLTMGDAAQALKIHESTVSQVVKDKYLQCSWGIYPLSWFFSAP